MKFPAHIAILGRQPELGLVELESRLGAAAMAPWGRYGVLLDQALPLVQLGGVVKLGRVLYHGPTLEVAQVPFDWASLGPAGGKITFALSYYGLKATSRFVLAAGLELKKRLRAHGSVRFVTPTEGAAVGAAALRHNGIPGVGFELLVVIQGQEMVVAVTTEVQDIDWYSRRDYDRPARSAKVGMLPPKLAQVLVNTTSEGALIADPFCGTGVVLQEALLLGRPAVGSDLAPDMVAASRANLTWLAEVAPHELLSWQVDQADARTVHLPEGCAVVSEGYLGPNLSHFPALQQLDPIRAQLRELYRAALANWAAQLKSGTELALCVPAWQTSQGWQYLDVVDDLARLGYTSKVFKHVRVPLLYARPDQVVGRQLLLLRKN